MLSGIILSVLLRTGQVIAESSTTVFCGFLIAGVMERMLGSSGIRALFGGRGLGGLFRAWGFGMLLPVCSLGVIPIAGQMFRSGVSTGTILAFVLAAPHINPLSLLYGLTLSEPLIILSFAIASLFLAIGSGLVWDCFFAKPENPPPEDAIPAQSGLKRLLLVGLWSSRASVGPSMLFILLALVVTGTISGLIPHGNLGQSMRHDDLYSPLLMAVIAIPAYSGPLPGMMRLGLMFEHGNSVGAAFVLFELGIGINIGLILWLLFMTGKSKILLWFCLVCACTVGVGYSMEMPLYRAQEEASHTHAFDDWTSPFYSFQDANLEGLRIKILEKSGPLEVFAMSNLAVLMLSGMLLNLLDPWGKLESWCNKKLENAHSIDGVGAFLQWNVPGPVLGFIAFLGLLVFSTIALFIHYPDRRLAFEDIARIRTEGLVAVRTGNWLEAVKRLEEWDQLTRKLQVGVFIRTGSIDPKKSRIAENLRESIEVIRDFSLAGNMEEAIKAIPEAEEAHRAFRSAYSND